MNEQLVSVILPTYNRIKTIKRAIDSVLNQTYKNIELIIVDDNSTDGTIDLVSELYGDDERIIYIMNDSNMGPSGARNTGVQAAHGEFIAFQDSDDIWHSDKLEKQMAMLMNADDDVAMIYCQFKLHTSSCKEAVWPPDNLPIDSKSGNIFPYVLIVALCGTPTMLIRKKCFIGIGGFSDNIKALEDYEFSVRLAKKYKILLCDEPLVDAYETENSVGKRNDENIHVECLIMNTFREDLEQFGLRSIKMANVWAKAIDYGSVEVIEDNIGILAADSEYSQTFAELENKRLEEIFNKSNIHIGIFLNDENITFGNGTRPERGNPGMDESRYELLLLIRYLAKRENGIAVTVYHFNNKNILPYDVKSIIVSDKYNALMQCKKDNQNCMVFIFEFNNEWYNIIDEYAIPSICVLGDSLDYNNSEFTKTLPDHKYIKKIIYYNKQISEHYFDNIDQRKISCFSKLQANDNSNSLKEWEALLTKVF